MTTEYDIGDLARITAAFTDGTSGAAIDPTAVSLTYKDPAGTLKTLVYGTDNALVKDSTGNYHADINVTLNGTWTYRWFSTGTGQAASEGTFQVRPQLVQ